MKIVLTVDKEELPYIMTALIHRTVDLEYMRHKWFPQEKPPLDDPIYKWLSDQIETLKKVEQQIKKQEKLSLEEHI